MSTSTPDPARRPAQRARAGQSLIEYALVISFVALLCIPAFSFLQTATQQAYDNQQDALNDDSFDSAAAPYIPPAATPTAEPTPDAEPTPTAPAYTTPTKKSQCNKNGWQSFNPPSGPFTGQQDCKDWVTNH